MGRVIDIGRKITWVDSDVIEVGEFIDTRSMGIVMNFTLPNTGTLHIAHAFESAEDVESFIKAIRMKAASMWPGSDVDPAVKLDASRMQFDTATILDILPSVDENDERIVDALIANKTKT